MFVVLLAEVVMFAAVLFGTRRRPVNLSMSYSW